MQRFVNFFNTPPRSYPTNHGTTANDPRRYRHSPGGYGLYVHQMQQSHPYSGSSSWTGTSRLTSIPRSSPRSSFTNGFFNVSESVLASVRGLTPQSSWTSGLMHGSWYGGSQRSFGSSSSGGFSNGFPVMRGGRSRGGSSRNSSMS